MGVVIHHLGARVGGGQCSDLNHLLQFGGAGEPFVCIGDLGDDPQYWQYPWGVPPQGGLLHSRDEASDGCQG